MSTLSGSNTKSVAAKRAAGAGFQFKIGHVLAAVLLLSLIAWGAVFLVIRLVVTALH